MTEKFNHFSKENMMDLAKTPAGQQLLSIVQQSGGELLQQAMGRAAAGDLEGAGMLLSPVLADPRVQALLRQLGGR